MSALTERAAKVQRDAESLTKSPAALLLPAPARELIRQLAALVSDMAVEIEKCVPGIPSK